MNRELTVRVVVGERQVHGLLVGLLLALFPQVLGSETVTLQTYYPSPFGVYTQLRTTNQTTLAETAGGVGIALGAGVTPDPSYKLHVAGSARITEHIRAQLRAAIGGASPGDTIGATNNWDLGVSANASLGGYLATARTAGCSGLGAGASCVGYATWVPGLAIQGTWYGPKTTMSNSYRSAGSTADWRLVMKYYDGTNWQDQWVRTSDFLDDLTSNAYCCSY